MLFNRYLYVGKCTRIDLPSPRTRNKYSSRKIV